MNKGLVTTALIFTLFPIVSHANQACGLLLQDGIFNTFFSRNDQSSISYTKQALCEQYTRNKNSNGSAGLDLGSIGISIGGSSVNSYGRLYCEDNVTFDQSISQDIALSQIASNDVINGYVACLDAVQRGVNYNIAYQGMYKKVAQVDLNVTQSSSSRLPVYNGVAVIPSGSAECNFVAGDPLTAPQPGDTLTPAFYTLQCAHTNYNVDTSVAIALDTIQGITITFSGTGDLKSNEYWEIQDNIDNAIAGLEEKRVFWNELPAESIADLRNIPRNGTACFDIPTSVPSDAKEIKLFIRVASNNNSNSALIYEIYTDNGSQKYYHRFYARLMNHNAMGYNSDNFWLPVTDDQEVCLSRNSATFSNDQFGGALELTGYR